MVTVSSTLGFVVRAIPKDRRRGAGSIGSSAGGPKPPSAGRDALGKGASSPDGPGAPKLPPQPEPELLGSTGSGGTLVGSCDRPNWAGSSTGLLVHAFVVDRMLPYPLIIRCSEVTAEVTVA
jgi:hypothetical protein